MTIRLWVGPVTGLIFALCPVISLTADAVPAYRITNTIALGAPDRWDYVVFDASSQRVYIAHGDRLTVVDGREGAVVGQVTGFAGGTHGIAIVSTLGKGFTDDGKAGEAGAFDLKSLTSGKHIKAAEDADAMVFDPVSAHVFVINGDSGSITVIDPKSEKALTTIAAGGKLESAIAGEGGYIYVNGAEKREILRLNTRSNAIDARWPIVTCQSPHGLAIDEKGHRLFASCVNNSLVVVNADSGATVATLTIGSGSDAAAYDPVRKRVFSSNGRDGTVSVIEEKNPNEFVALESIKTAISARTMAIDPSSGRLYLVAAHLQGGGSIEPGHRPAVVPGSLRLLFLDPAQ